MASDLIRLAAATACAFVALLFVRAALHKMGDAARFEGVLADYGLVPDVALRAATRAVPALELACAAALALGPARAFGAWAGVALLMGYAGAMGLNLMRGRTEIDCGCGGAPEPLSWALVARNLLLSAALVPAALGAAAPLAWTETLTAWAVGLLILLCWGGVEQLLANAGRMRQDARSLAQSAFGGAS